MIVREAVEADRAYVLSTWVESEADHARLPGDAERVYGALRGKARRLLARSRVLVAAPDDDAVTVLAWLAVDRTLPLAHYGYTRRALRGQGLQRDLAVSAGLVGRVTITTSRPRRQVPLRAVYDPVTGWMLAVSSEEAA